MEYGRAVKGLQVVGGDNGGDVARVMGLMLGPSHAGGNDISLVSPSLG